MTQSITLYNVILSHPHLFTPKAYKQGDEPRYSAQLILMDDSAWPTINQAVEAAVVEKFGNIDEFQRQKLRMPWSQVDKGPYQGKWQIAAYSYPPNAPQIVDQNVNPIVSEIDPMTRKALVFPGCKVNVNIRVYGYQQGGVTAGLNMIQVVDNSDNMLRLDSRQDAADVFQPVNGGPAIPQGGMPQGGSMQNPGMQGGPMQNQPPMQNPGVQGGSMQNQPPMQNPGVQGGPMQGQPAGTGYPPNHGPDYME